MTISRGPVIRLALGFLTIIAIVALAGGYAAQRLEAAVLQGHLLARELIPGLGEAINVERYAARALSALPRDPQSAWYLEKTGEAIAQALATLDEAKYPAQAAAARQVQEAFARFAAGHAARRDAEAARDEAQATLADAYVQVETAAVEVRQQWEVLSPEVRNAGVTGSGFAGVWEARDQMGAAARLAATGSARGSHSYLEEAGWRMQSARRALQREGAAPEHPGDASPGTWHETLARFSAATEQFGASLEQVRDASRSLAREAASAASEEETLWRNAQGFTRSCATAAGTAALQVAGALDTMAGVWWLAMSILLVAALAIALVTIASTGRTLEEANLPMLCQCGKLNAPTAHFCGRCGQEFT